MPYISPLYRPNFDEHTSKIFPTGAGDLNYVITTICHNYLRERGTNYQNVNDIIGVLECAKQEFYRRIVSPYEDKKIKQNGDVLG